MNVASHQQGETDRQDLQEGQAVKKGQQPLYCLSNIPINAARRP
jgi:hypothetical protein